MSKTEWKIKQTPRLKTALQDQVYGHMPDRSSVRVVKHEVLTPSAFNNLGQIEEYTLIATAEYTGQSVDTAPFKMVVVTPRATKTPSPIILIETFCPNHNTINHPKVNQPRPDGFSCGSGGIMDKIMLNVFGRYIATPPLEMILQRGYAVATIFPSEFVPDRSTASLRALRSLSNGYSDDNTRWGAIAAWGWGYSRMIDVLEADPRYHKDAFIAYGHSRYGKAALVAGAFDNRIDGVIAHQSGTGGASLNMRKKGESIAEITKTFPHWFSKSYEHYESADDKQDQHALLGLIAPRPIMLGNARRDVWSDPNGAFRAAQGASEIYNLYGKQGLQQNRLKPFIPGADISFYIRPGTHGVVKEDWPAFLEFLDAHF